jgi:hypothetical protein
MRHQELKKWLAHPLCLLIIGALISSYLIPSWTRRWQDHQKELELKVDLMREISESLMGMIVRIETVESVAEGNKAKYVASKGDDPNLIKNLAQGYTKQVEEMQSYFLEWMVKRDIIGANIRAFFPDKSELVLKWEDLVGLVYWLEALSEAGENVESRKALLNTIRERFFKGKSFPDLDKLAQRNLDNWFELKRRAITQRDEVIRKISESTISAF